MLQYMMSKSIEKNQFELEFLKLTKPEVDSLGQRFLSDGIDIDELQTRFFVLNEKSLKKKCFLIRFDFICKVIKSFS